MRTVSVDLAVARHFADIAVAHYRRAGRPMDLRMRNYLEVLDRGFAAETSSDTEESSSIHDIVTVREAAQLLNCSEQWVRRICADLGGQRLAGRWVFDRREVIEYAVAKQERGA